MSVLRRFGTRASSLIFCLVNCFDGKLLVYYFKAGTVTLACQIMSNSFDWWYNNFVDRLLFLESIIFSNWRSGISIGFNNFFQASSHTRSREKAYTTEKRRMFRNYINCSWPFVYKSDSNCRIKWFVETVKREVFSKKTESTLAKTKQVCIKNRWYIYLSCILNANNFCQSNLGLANIFSALLYWFHLTTLNAAFLVFFVRMEPIRILFLATSLCADTNLTVSSLFYQWAKCLPSSFLWSSYLVCDPILFSYNFFISRSHYFFSLNLFQTVFNRLNQ